MRTAIVIVLLGVTATAAHAQIAVGQIDTFESGSTLNWTNGAPAANPSLQLGGPAGAADNFLRITNNGNSGGAGSRLVAFNPSQWVGDYTTAGIGSVGMNLRNLSASPLAIRIGFKQAGGSGSAGYVSPAFTLPADGTWHAATFAIDSSLLPVNGPPALATVLGGSFAEFRVLHSVGNDLLGDTTPGTATAFGVDNIRAIAVPEPTSLSLLGVAAAGWLWRRKKATGRRGDGATEFAS